jgi:hypothetical protein
LIFEKWVALPLLYHPVAPNFLNFRTVKKSPLKKPLKELKEHPYVNIPLEEIYEQLISQLESLCDAGSKADIILSQQSQIQLTSQEKPAEDVVENATNKFGPPYVLKYFWRMCLRVSV